MAAKWDWDPRKNTSNIRKHGIDFANAVRMFDGIVVERMDPRAGYGETRWIAIGIIDEREIVAVYTERGEERRMISARRATRHERQKYWTYIGGG